MSTVNFLDHHEQWAPGRSSPWAQWAPHHPDRASLKLLRCPPEEFSNQTCCRCPSPNSTKHDFHTVPVFTTCIIVAGRREVLVASQTFLALSSLLVGGGPKCWLLNLPSKKRGCRKKFLKEETLEYIWISWMRELTVGNRCSVRGVATFLPLPSPSSTEGTYFMCIMQKLATTSSKTGNYIFNRRHLIHVY